MFLRDFKVKRRRSAEEIENLAAYWRRLDQSEHNPAIDMVRFIYRTIPSNVKDRDVSISERDDLGVDAPAYVQFRKLETGRVRARLFVEKETIKHARIGSPDDKYVVAHEGGHLIMHDTNCLRLSPDPDHKLKSFEREELAEWQAHRFARALVAPYHLANRFCSVDELVRVFDISEDTALRRLDDFEEIKINRAYYGEACSDCGNFTLMQNGTSLKCNTCG